MCVATRAPPTPHPPAKFLFQEVVVSCFVRCLSQVLQVLWCCTNSLSSLLFSAAPRQPKWCFESGQTAINLLGSPPKPGTLVDCSSPPCPSQRRSFKVGFPSQAWAVLAWGRGWHGWNKTVFQMTHFSASLLGFEIVWGFCDFLTGIWSTHKGFLDHVFLKSVFLWASEV